MMTTNARRRALGAAAALVSLILPSAATAQSGMPAGWRWTTDSPAPVRAQQAADDSSWRFSEIAPGWHVTTRPPRCTTRRR